MSDPGQLDKIEIAGKSYDFREVTYRDTEELHEIDVICFPPGRAFTEGYFLLLFFYEDALGWALEEEGRIIAFILLTTKQKRFNVATIDVLPDYRRRGLGAGMLEYAEAKAKESGGTAMTLQVEQSNTSAIRLYHRLGYEKVKPLPKYYEDADGWQMRKSLI